MVDTTEAKDRLNRAVEVEVGADGETPVSPNNPPAKANYVSRLNAETPSEDESQGGDRDGYVSPNNPPEKTHTVSDGGLNGFVPEGVSEAVVEASFAEQYPASYQPVKDDTDEDGQPIYTDVVKDEDGEDVREADEVEKAEADKNPVVEAANKEQEPAGQPTEAEKKAAAKKAASDKDK